METLVEIILEKTCYNGKYFIYLYLNYIIIEKIYEHTANLLQI